MLNSIDKKILEVERNGGKDGKALCKLMLYMKKQWAT